MTYTQLHTGERVPSTRGHEFASDRITANRKAGSDVGELRTVGRTSALERQRVADSLATVIETATLVQVEARRYEVRFVITHRIVPIERS